jgi:hypothetical protein
MAVLLARALPKAAPAAPVSYGEVMKSLGDLLRQHPRLRSRALIGGTGFATVSVLFSTMALLAGPGFELGSDDRPDRHRGHCRRADGQCGGHGRQGTGAATTLAGAILMLLGWLCLWLGGSRFLLGLLVVDGARRPCTSATRTWSMHWRPRPDRASMPSI